MGVNELIGGELLRVRLHSSRGDNDMVTRFVGFAQEGGYLRARFQEDGATFVWNARESGSKWLYGVNETEFLTVEEILQPGSGGYMFDKHLVKLAARRRPGPEDEDFQPDNHQYRRSKRAGHSGLPRRG